MKSEEMYKVWPKQQNLEAFVQGRAEQVITEKVEHYFSPLEMVRAKPNEMYHPCVNFRVKISSA